MRNRDISRVAKSAVAGLIAGIVASFVMSEFQSIISKMGESNGSKKEEKPANIKSADEVSENVFDHTLTKEEEKTAGPAVHYAMGAASGLIYGITSEITPVSTLGVGLPFGAAVW